MRGTDASGNKCCYWLISFAHRAFMQKGGDLIGFKGFLAGGKIPYRRIVISPGSSRKHDELGGANISALLRAKRKTKTRK
jgi:hypothetical protein